MQAAKENETGLEKKCDQIPIMKIPIEAELFDFNIRVVR